MRFPLFTLRILGDGIAALLKGIVRILPVGGTRRAAWRECREPDMGVAAQQDQLQGVRGVAASRLRRRHGVGVPEMPDADAAHGVAGAVRRGPLAADFVRRGDGDARHPVCEGAGLAGLDAASASGRDRDRQEQAPGAAGLSGVVAAGEAASDHAGDDRVLALARDALSRAEDRLSLPADRSGGGGGRRRPSDLRRPPSALSQFGDAAAGRASTRRRPDRPRHARAAACARRAPGAMSRCSAGSCNATSSTTTR